MNDLKLLAELAERDAMRYSPSGVPIINAKLKHRSQQMEAGVLRMVELEINALAAGELASRMEQLPFEESFMFSGFLAKRNRNSKSLVFHIIDMSSPQLGSNLDTGANHGIR